MKLTLIFIFLLFLTGFPTESKIRSLKGKTFEYKNKTSILRLNFVNDTLLYLTHTFRCQCLDPEVKEIKQVCTYKVSDDSLFVKNILCKTEPCIFESNFNIPIQDCSKCWFLSAKAREQVTAIYMGPHIYTDYEKHGIVPQIDVDTFYIVNNRIFIIKYIPFGSDKQVRRNQQVWMLKLNYLYRS